MNEHFINRIEIKNFKCFEDFKAEGFGRVNLIGGKNNIGKTALMEACYVNVHSQNIESLTNVLYCTKLNRNYIEVMGSKSKLLDKNYTKYKRVSDKIGFEIKKALFIFDCDFEKDDKNCNGISKSLNCFNNLTKELNWNIPIDVYIFEKNLDYFLVETINKKECYRYFDELVECLDIEKLKWIFDE